MKYSDWSSSKARRNSQHKYCSSGNRAFDRGNCPLQRLEDDELDAREEGRRGDERIPKNVREIEKSPGPSGIEEGAAARLSQPGLADGDMWKR